MTTSLRRPAALAGVIDLSQPQPLPDRLSAGTVLAGRFQLTALHVVGSNAELWEAREIDREARLVIKVATRNDTRFDRDNLELCMLAHPNLASVETDGQLPDGRVFCVFEHVNGCQLRRLITRATTLEATGAIVTQVAQALVISHAQGGVHGRLCPEHILLCDTDRARYPFGLVKLLGLGSSIGAANPGYCAPEQLTDEEPDARADVFALGAIAVELLSGRGPFAASSLRADAVLERRRRGRPPTIELADDVAYLRPSLVRALAEHPADRFPSVGGLIEALTGTSLAGLARGSVTQVLPVKE